MVDAQLALDATYSEKSTNVRLRPLPIPAWFRLGFKTLQLVSPGLAARLGRRLFFAPQRIPARSEDDAVLARAERSLVDTRFGRVICRAWGTGPAVLLVHGWSGRSGQMTGLVEPLLEAGYRVVAIDLPAHGESEGKRASLVHFCEAITAALDRFGPFHGIVAHSLGTSGVLLAIARGVTAERVVFFAPPARFEPIWDRFRTGLGIGGRVWRRIQAESEAWLDVKFETIVPVILAPKMTAPLLVLHDGADREVLFEEGAELARVWPGARLVRTDGLGHVRLLKDPAAIEAAVRFIAA